MLVLYSNFVDFYKVVKTKSLFMMKKVIIAYFIKKYMKDTWIKPKGLGLRLECRDRWSGVG